MFCHRLCDFEVSGRHSTRCADYGSWSPDIIVVPSAYPCWICRKSTNYVEVNFEAHICSRECEERAWDAYFAAGGE